MNLTELFAEHAAARPETIAIIDGRRQITYQGLAQRAQNGAAGLTRLGLEPGDHVLVMVPMSIELYVVVLALLRAGLVATFVDPGAGPHVMTTLCERVEPRAFVGSSKAQLLTLRHRVLRRIPLKLNTGFAWCGRRWPADPGVQAIVPVPAHHAAIVTCTSGSTGAPKIACRTHGLLRKQHQAIINTIEPQAGQRQLVTLPVVALTTLGAGQTVIVPNANLARPGAINPAPVLAQVKHHQPHTLIASPAFIERLTQAPRAAHALRHVQRIITGGGPVFPTLCERITAALPATALMAVYGSTEAEPIAELNWRDASTHDRRAMAAGRGLLAGYPVADIELKVLDNGFGTPRQDLTAAELARDCVVAGTVGEIVVSGAHVLPGYVNGRGDEDTKFRVGDTVWHRTGDAGALDRQGRLWLAGRADQAINDQHGECYPFTVETAAMSMPGMRRAAFTATHGARWLLYERTSALTPDERAALAWAGIDRFARARIPMDTRHNSKVDHTALTRLVQTLAAS